MSNFENYSSTSSHYDDGRVPVGAKEYAYVIQSYLNKSFSEVSIYRPVGMKLIFWGGGGLHQSNNEKG